MCRVRRVTDENGRALTSAGPSTPCEITGAWSAMPEAGDDGIAVVNDAAGKQCLEWFRTRQQRVAAAHAQLVSSQRRAEMAASLEHRMEELDRLEVRLRFLKGKGDRRLIYEVELSAPLHFSV